MIRFKKFKFLNENKKDINSINLEKFQKNGLWGLRDSSTDEYLVEPKYDWIDIPNDKGISIVKLDGKYALIDWNTGKEIVETKYTYISQPNSKGISLVELEISVVESGKRLAIFKYGLLNYNTGEVIVEPKYDSFYNSKVIGISLVIIEDNHGVKKYGYIDFNTGDILIDVVLTKEQLDGIEEMEERYNMDLNSKFFKSNLLYFSFSLDKCK